MESDTLLIGVDGGATEVKAHAAACDDWDRAETFELGAASASRTYERLPEFVPQVVAEQLAQREAGSMQLSPAERTQGALWVDAARDAIREVASACDARAVLVGIGMPGLKSADGRGICVINNGPRIPDYLDRLEQGLRDVGLELVSPVAALGSDADYCGLGEEYAASGMLRDIENVYYVGGGTGLADALKLRGRLLPFDQAKTWILKSWQMNSALGPTFEKLVSAKAFNERYADLISAKVSPPAEFPYPECEAAEGQPIAVGWLESASLALAELVFERLDTIGNGRRESPHRGDAYLGLNDSHEYRGVLLDRVIIGQRIGQIYADNRFRSVFGQKVDAYLAGFIAASGSPEMVARYLDRGQLKPGLLCPSRLRAAPALGAAIAAVRAWSRK